MCRKHTLKTFNGNAASRLAFETTFETLTAAGQSSAQVDLFRFGQEQCVLWTRPASFELAGKLISGLHCLTPDHISIYGESAVADGPIWRLLISHDPFKHLVSRCMKIVRHHTDTYYAVFSCIMALTEHHQWHHVRMLLLVASHLLVKMCGILHAKIFGRKSIGCRGI